MATSRPASPVRSGGLVGGPARARRLAPARRSAIAKQAAEARWRRHWWKDAKDDQRTAHLPLVLGWIKHLPPSGQKQCLDEMERQLFDLFGNFLPKKSCPPSQKKMLRQILGSMEKLGRTVCEWEQVALVFSRVKRQYKKGQP